LFDATSLYHFRWRKKKVESFIIPPTYFRKNDYSIADITRATESIPIAIIPAVNDVIILTPKEPESKPISTELTKNNASFSNEPQVSAFSISSIRAKKALEESNKAFIKEELHLPTESFTETAMLLQWTKYAKRLGEKGFRIMESLLLINDPVLSGVSITLELPNEGSKLDFDKELNGLLGHLKGHLHNHDITIEVIVNESIQSRKNFNDQDRYNRLHEINPNIDLLRTIFGLDLNA
jgi:DNA polymerase-3 subunit gamma/tau